MKYSTLLASTIMALGLSACDKPPTVVNVPATPSTVPGPAGPQGDAGTQGATGTQGTKGDTGNTGSPGKTDGDTIVVVPAKP